jgi:hypothetical protein
MGSTTAEMKRVWPADLAEVRVGGRKAMASSLSRGGGWPSINFPTKMMYRIPAAASNQDTLAPAAATRLGHSPSWR